MAGIKERLIQVILRGKDLLSPEANKSKKALDELRASGEQLREELDKAKDDNNLVRSLSALEKESERAQKTADRTAAKVVELRGELDKNSDSKGLSQSLKDAEREAEKAQKALDSLKTETTAMAEKAKAAGIDTGKLSDEEKRLAAELEKAKAAVSDNSKATKDLQKEQAAAARSAAEQTSRIASLREALKNTEKRVLGYAAAYVSLKAAMSAVRGVTDFVVSGFKSVFNGASESEQVLAQLNAALASTEGAIGITADELQRMGLEMRKTSMLSTEQITEMQVALLTYTDIAKEEFPRALQVAIDQQQRLGISITQSAELVGKALQDPSKAMVALGRQGFKLEESQKTLLKQLEDTGRTAEAQAIIMDMLAESYGGSAAAARYGTFKGVWKGITDTFSDFQSKIADSGSFDLVKNKLQDFSDLLTEMEQDGTLDALAMSISSAFEVGAEKVEQFIRSIAKVDFKTLTQDSTDWLNNFSQNVDDAMLRIQLFIAPFRTLFNGLTAGLSAFGIIWLQQLNLILLGAEKIADAFGGEKLKASLASARDQINGLTEGLVEQIEQDGADIRAAWETTANAAVDAKQKEVDAVKAAELAKQKAHADTSKAIDAMFAAEVEAARAAAVEGRRNIEDLADALDVIDTTDSVAELEKLRSALLKAYQEGRISQQEFEQGTGVLNGKIKTLGDTATGTAKNFKTLEGVMSAIAKAANNLDTRAAQQALDKLYKEGTITAKEHAKAQDELNKKIAELKPAAEESTKAVKGLATELKDVQSSAEDVTGALGRVGGAAQSSNADIDFFSGTLSAARSTLAGLSDTALKAFDDLQGIKTPDSIDTSSISSVTDALMRARQEASNLSVELSGPGLSTFGRWQLETMKRSKDLEASYLGQKESLLSLMATVNSGGLSLEYMSEMAGMASSRFDLLSESDLSPLIAAANQAKEAMRAFSESTQSTVDNLRMELLQLRGTEEEIAKARAEQRRNELREQLAMAEKNNDMESIARLQEALGLLNQIESEQINRIRTAAEEKAAEAQRKEQEAQQKAVDAAQREADAQRKEAESKKQAAEREKEAKNKAREKDSTGRPVIGQQYQQPAAGSPIVTRVIRIESRSGQGVDLGIRSASDEIKLLSVLEDAGLRSL